MILPVSEIQPYRLMSLMGGEANDCNQCVRLIYAKKAAETEESDSKQN